MWYHATSENLYSFFKYTILFDPFLLHPLMSLIHTFWCSFLLFVIKIILLTISYFVVSCTCDVLISNHVINKVTLHQHTTWDSHLFINHQNYIWPQKTIEIFADQCTVHSWIWYLSYSGILFLVNWFFGSHVTCSFMHANSTYDL